MKTLVHSVMISSELLLSFVHLDCTMSDSEFSFKRQLDEICDQFEERWSPDGKIEFDGYLSQIHAEHRERLMRMLLEVDVELRTKQELPVSSQDYEHLSESAVAFVRELLEVDMDVTVPPSNSHRSDSDETETSPPTRSEAAGRQIGPYKLLQQIGEGGMGSVWMAEQEQPVRRRVALKLIRGDMGSKETIARFEAERQALAMMDHQNIAKVLDAGTTDDGSPFFVMELVKGIPLTQYCDENKLSIQERLELFVPVCNAIQHAHQKGIIHRDLKPSNVLVTLYDGKPVPKVIDFGLAKALEHTTKLTDKTMFTEFGKVVGTVQYMAPEQAEMNALDVDTRTDVYSLGVMLYELLTGSTPLDKETIGENALLQILAIIREKEPPRPSHRLSSSGDSVTGISEQRKINPSKLQQILRGELDWIVMKALEKDRTRRYETANGLAMDIERYLGDEPIVARPPSTSYRISKFLKKNRTFVATTAVIVLLLLAGIIGTSLFAYKADKAADRARESAIAEKRQREIADEKTAIARGEKEKAKANERRALIAEDLAEAEAQRARDSEASAKFQLANARWDANRVAEARDVLQQIPVEYRDNFEWHFCNRHFLGSDFTCFGHTEDVESVAYSPNGALIASGSRDNTVRVWDAKSGLEINSLKGHEGPVESVTFSPDGTRIAAAGGDDETVYVWDVDTGIQIKTLKGHRFGIKCVAFSPDGKRIASGSDDNTIKIWDVKTAAEICTLRGHAQPVVAVTFSPDGARIASGSVDNTIKIWDPKTGQKITTFLGQGSFFNSVAFSPDGTRIAAAGGDDETVYVWDVDTGIQIKTLKGHRFGIKCVAFSPDGKRIASGSDDNTIKIWDVKTAAEIFTFKGHRKGVNSVTFSPDGTRIASGSEDMTIKVWDAKTGQAGITLNSHLKSIFSVAFSPDGTRIASGSGDNTIKIWDANTGQEVKTLVGHTDDLRSVTFNLDGTRIVSGSDDNSVKIWDAKTGAIVKTLKGHSTNVADVTFSPDGKRIASGSWDCSIKLWDAVGTTGKELTTLAGHTGTIFSVAFSPDGTRIASGSSDNTIKIWDANTGQEVKTLVGHTDDLRSVAFNLDGTRIVSGSDDNSVKIWDARTGAIVKTLIGHAGTVLDVIFSPDGTRIASGSSDNTIKIWDAKTGAEIITLKGHASSVFGVTFSPDGTRIASGSSDNTIKIWTAKPAQEIIVAKQHSSSMNRVFFSPDGTRIVCECENNILKAWDVGTGLEICTFKGHESPVISVAFSLDGTRIASGSWHKILKVWQAASGREIITIKGHQGLVTKVEFSKDGRMLFSHNTNESFVWDIETGKQIEGVDWIEKEPNSGFSSDGRWMVLAADSGILLVDRNFKDAPDEKAYRIAKGRLDPNWHTEQAKISQKDKNWYAATFNYAWAMNAQAADLTNYDNLHFAHRKLIEQYEAANKTLDLYLTPFVKEMLKLPRGGVDSK